MSKIIIVSTSIISTIVLLLLINNNQDKQTELRNRINYIIQKNDSLRRSINEKDSLINILSDSLRMKLSKPVVLSNGITATWYQAHGSKTYSGEVFHKDSLTAAYHAKMGTYLKVTNKSNGKSVIVKVTDRMGSSHKNKIDLSKKAFESIANINSGRIKVIVEKI